MSNYLDTLKLGDYADIIVDGAIHKGMPHQYYQGRTGSFFLTRPHLLDQQEVRGNPPVEKGQTEKGRQVPERQNRARESVEHQKGFRRESSGQRQDQDRGQQAEEERFHQETGRWSKGSPPRDH